MKEIYKALAAFQQEVPIIHKGVQGYGYSYANLAEIVEIITPILKKHNLGFYQQLFSNSISETKDVTRLKTVIFHTLSGEIIDSEVDLDYDKLEYVEVEKTGKDKKPYKVSVIRGFDGMNIPQAKGAIITYFRRYSLSCVLGLISDVDSDARNARIEDKTKPLPELHPENEKNWNNIVKVLATKQYDIERVKTKWIIPEQHEERLAQDVVDYVIPVKTQAKSPKGTLNK